MTDLPHVAGRIFNRPLLVEPRAMEAMLAPLRARLGVDGPAPGLDLRITAEGPVLAPRAMDQEDEREAERRRRSRRYPVTGEGVAIIPVHGALVARAGQITPDCTELRSYQAIERDMAAALRDPDVRGIVLDIDSPGGEAANVMELSGRLAAQRGGKLIVALVNPGAYSAAYALASAADRIVLPPSAGVGSVGVVALHVDRSAEDEKRGHRYTWIAAGARKLDGNPHAPLTKDAHGVIQAEVDRLYGLFVETVAGNRTRMGLTPAKVRASEAGLFFGENAVAAGFADEVGGMAEALRLAAGAASNTGRGRPSANRPSEGATMDETNKADPSASNPPPAPDTAAIVAAAQKAAAESAKAIAALCTIAGCPAKAAEYIAEGRTEAQVRDLLLAQRVERGAEGGEVNATRPPAAGVLGAQPGQPGAAMPPAAVAASWNRVGTKLFGDKWKGF